MYLRDVRGEADEMFQGLSCLLPFLRGERLARVVGVAIQVGFSLLAYGACGKRKQQEIERQPHGTFKRGAKTNHPGLSVTWCAIAVYGSLTELPGTLQ